jgi:hypothetical protein
MRFYSFSFSITSVFSRGKNGFVTFVMLAPAPIIAELVSIPSRIGSNTIQSCPCESSKRIVRKGRRDMT